MDLMTLAAKITLDDSGFNKGVNQAESTGKKLAGKMSAMTVAVGNIAADMIKKGASAIKSIVDGAVDGYADYEQLIGGVETLFKDSAGKVEKYANKSFKTTGLSANAYMETVTSFSASLLQGLQGDTERAADMANMAVTDMADNANKMGTDISSIQTAYQGFAKQNYTMLDNLKLGYGGTREEMIRLINDSGILGEEIKSLDGITFDQIVEAIHEMQTQLGITGTTAKEAASTISGSKNSLKAAWEDMLAAAGGKDDKAFYSTLDNFKQSFSTYMENYVPSLILSIKSGGGIAKAIAEAITDLPTQLLSDLGSAVISTGTDVVGGVSDITHWLIESITNMFRDASANPDQIAEFGKAIGDFLGSAISDIVTNAPDILKGIIDVGVQLAGGLVEGLFKGLFGEGAQVEEVMDQMNETIEDAEYKATKSSAIVSYLKSLADTYGDAATETQAWKQAVDELQQIVPETKEIFEAAGNNVEFLLGPLDNMIAKMREAAIQAGLMKALQDAYSMLGEQSTELHYQQRVARQKQGEMDAIKNGIISDIQKTAKSRMDEMDEMGGPETIGQKDLYNKYSKLAEGLSHVGDMATSLSDLDFEGLHDALNFLDMGDQYSVERINGMKQAYVDADTAMQEAKTKADAAAKEIEATNEFISSLESATQDAAASLGTSLDNTASGIDSGGAAVAAALAAAAAGIAAAGGYPGGGSAGGDWKAGKGSSIQPHGYQLYTPNATGMDYIPYNGYRAELHRGEMILTKAEAEQYRKGNGSAEIVGALHNLNNNIQNMQLVVGRKTFGRAVVGYGGNRMNGYIGRAESRRSSGYGT